MNGIETIVDGANQNSANPGDSPRMSVSQQVRVTIDARWLSTGIGTYTLNVVSRLKSCGSIYLRALTSSAQVSLLERICDEVRITDAPIYGLREQVQIPIKAGTSGLLHVPHYNAPLLYPGTLLVSILDLTHILDATYRQTWKSMVYARPMFHLVARKAVHIFTLSEYSKSRIRENLGIPEEKITVTHCGVGPQYIPIDPEFAREYLRRELHLEGRYILYIGNLKPHKNIPAALHAFARLKKQSMIDHRMLIVGDDPTGRPKLERLTQQLGIDDAVTFMPYVSSDLLPKIYSGADALVFPSFEEGFGLPVIEAMACGTPVVCSNAASMPEVAGDSAAMFNPNDVDELVNVLGEVLNSSKLQGKLRRSGLQRAKCFNWQQCAMRHYEVYSRHCEA